MATIEEMQTIVAGLTQEYINKASFEEKIKLSLDSIELCIAEHADKRIPRYAGWVSGDGMQQTESWFSEKAEAMRNLVDLYEADIAKNMEMLTELQLLSAQLWLAISHSMMIRMLP